MGFNLAPQHNITSTSDQIIQNIQNLQIHRVLGVFMGFNLAPQHNITSTSDQIIQNIQNLQIHRFKSKKKHNSNTIFHYYWNNKLKLD